MADDTSRPVVCTNCEHVLGMSDGEQEPGACPDCGARSRAVAFELHVQVGLSMAARAKVGRKTLKAKARREETKDGPHAGTMARVEQTVDQINGTYSKRVTLEDGTVVKDVPPTPIRDQDVHGPQ